ncbi:MAG: MMPL family transporter [candidate division KSB1 bacterium]|nr:MMPL family transporter [candidate division KSB1 bacterium]
MRRAEQTHFLDLTGGIIRLRHVWIALGLFASAAGFFLAARVPVNTDIVSFLPRKSIQVQRFRYTDQLFGGNHLAVVGVEAEDVFTTPLLQVVDSLTTAFGQIEGVSSVTSLTNVIDFRKTDWGIEVTKLIEPGRVPQDPEELERLRSYTLARSLYRDKLVSSDAKITLLLVRIRGDVDREKVARELRTVSRRIVGHRYRLYFAGFPFQMEFLGRLIIADMWRLTPLAAALILMVLYASFRTHRGVVLAFSAVAVSLVWTLGLMGLFRVPLTLISAATPVLVLAVGSAYGIHLLRRYYELAEPGIDSRALVTQTLREVGLPIVLAAGTTLIGFLSLLSSELSAIRQFGLVTGAGILFALAATSLIVTAALCFLPPQKAPRLDTEAASPSSPLLRLAGSVQRHPGRWALAMGAVFALGLSGLPRIRREVNLSEYFRRNSEVRVSERLMEERFGGSYPAQVLLEGPMEHPAILHWMRQLELRLEADPTLTNGQSVADLICEMNYVLNDRYVVPETEEGVGNLWFLLEGQEILEQLVTADRRHAQVQLRIRSQRSDVIFRCVDLINRALNSLPDTIVAVRDSGVSPTALALLDSFRIAEAEEILRWQLLRRDLPEPDTAVLHQTLRNYVAELRAPHIPPPMASRMAETVLQFLSSEECELSAPSPTQSERLRAALEAGFRRNGVLSSAEIAKILRVVLPGAQGVDEETLLRTAGHAAYLARETRLRALTDSAAARLAAQLGSITSVDPELRRDLQAVFWTLGEGTAYVPAPTFRAWQKCCPLRPDDEVVLRALQSGAGPVYKELDAKLLRSQVINVVTALGLVFVLLCLQLRSLSLGLIATSPILLTLAVNFGAMGYLHIPLDDATLMIAPLAIGIGVDYTIHFSHRLQKELLRSSSFEQALRTTFGSTGRAIWVNALSVGAGFCVLLLGQVEPVRRFGVMVATAMGVSAFGSVTLLPSLFMLALHTQDKREKGGHSGSRASKQFPFKEVQR